VRVFLRNLRRFNMWVIKNRYLLVFMLGVLVVHTIPMLGIFMSEEWYKYAYIVGSYAIGCVFLVKWNWWYLKNDK